MPLAILMSPRWGFSIMYAEGGYKRTHAIELAKSDNLMTC